MYSYTLKLNPSKEQRKELEKRFRMATDIYRNTLFEIFKRVRKQKKDPLYKQAYKLPKGKERNAILKTLDKKIRNRQLAAIHYDCQQLSKGETL